MHNNFQDYISPNGYKKLKKELLKLISEDRPKIVEVVSWAAKNGDRSENGDYIYGKKRLREIDRKIRFLTISIENLQVVDPLDQFGNNQIFFGAKVEFLRNKKNRETIVIVGTQETNLDRGHISWNSPIAKAVMKKKSGDTIEVITPAGLQEIKILSVSYKVIEN